jgi:hypothetical protein
MVVRAPVVVPFDPHSHQVALAASAAGVDLKLLLDTALDPSAIDSALAARLGLARASANAPIEGVGSDAATAYDSVLPALSLGQHRLGPIDVAVFDMAKLRNRFGRPLDGILGYSFLKDRAVVIDYAADRVSIFERGADPDTALAGCKRSHRVALRFVSEEDRLIVIPGLAIAGVEVPAMLDTGSSNGLRIEDKSPQLASVRHLLPAGEAGTSVGARGEAPQRRATLAVPVTLGPFTVERAEVALVDRRGAVPVNIGNRFLRAMRTRLLVDMPRGRVEFHGDCG